MEKHYCRTCGKEARVYLKKRYNTSTGKPFYSINLKCRHANTIKEALQVVTRGLDFTHDDYRMGYINTDELPEEYKDLEIE